MQLFSQLQSSKNTELKVGILPHKGTQWATVQKAMFYTVMEIEHRKEKQKIVWSTPQATNNPSNHYIKIIDLTTLLNRKFALIPSSLFLPPHFYSGRKNHFLILCCPVPALRQVLLQQVSLFSLALLDACMLKFQSNQTEKLHIHTYLYSCFSAWMEGTNMWVSFIMQHWVSFIMQHCSTWSLDLKHTLLQHKARVIEMFLKFSRP